MQRADPSPEGVRSESGRARPLALEARQEMIIAIVIPLILARGRDVTSKEIAEACGIAEGTIFRAFGDKETLLDMAVERYLDPQPLLDHLASIGADLPLDAKLRAVLGLLVERFSGVIRLMMALGRQGPPPRRDPGDDAFTAVIDDLLAPHRHELRVSSDTIAQYARVLAFASSLPVFGDSIPLSTDDLVDVFVHGVADPDHHDHHHTDPQPSEA